MNYQEAFNKTINTYGIKIIENRFLFSSILYDYVGDSFENKMLIHAFSTLNYSGKLYESIKGKLLAETKEYIKGLIVKSDKNIDSYNYIKSVEPLLFILFPSEYTEYKIKNDHLILLSKENKKVTKTNNTLMLNNIASKYTYQKGISLKGYNSVLLNIKCRDLTIGFSNKRSYKIINEKGKDITNKYRVNIYNKILHLDIKETNSNIRVELPQHLYENFNLDFCGSTLSMTANDINKVSFRNMELKGICNNAYIKINSKIINLNFRACNLTLMSEFYALKACGTYSNFNLITYAENLAECKIKLIYGNINLCFGVTCIFPRIKHLFRPIKFIHGDYFLANKVSKLDISTFHGKIKLS